MARLGIVRAVTAERIDRHIGTYLVEQIGQNFTIALVLMDHQRGTDLARVRINSQVRVVPRAPFGPAMLAYLSFSLSGDLQSDAVNQEVQGRFGAPRWQYAAQAPCSLALASPSRRCAD